MLKGKRVKHSFNSKNVVSTSQPLRLLHMDLFVSTKIASLDGKRYGLVIVDDYIWVMFLAHKNESFKVFNVTLLASIGEAFTMLLGS